MACHLQVHDYAEPKIYSINLTKARNNRRLWNDLQPTRKHVFFHTSKQFSEWSTVCLAHNWKLIAVSILSNQEYKSIYETMRQIVGSLHHKYFNFFILTIFPNVTSENNFIEFPVLITNQSRKFGDGHKKNFQLCFFLCFYSYYSSLQNWLSLSFIISPFPLSHIYTSKYSNSCEMRERRASTREEGEKKINNMKLVL